MSKWTEFRDSVEASLDIGTVTEQVKQEFTGWLVETALPLAEKAGDAFIAQVQTQAKSETGWNKARDLVILPAVIRGGLWLAKTVLTKTQKEQGPQEPLAEAA